MTYEVKLSKRYRHDLKRVLAGGADESKLNKVVDILASGAKLPKVYDDHPLRGQWKGFRECHIDNDWLLVYKKYKDALILLLMRTGTHAEVLGM